MFSNPMNLIRMMTNSTNPQQFLINFLSQQTGGNPFFSNLIVLAQSNRGSEIEMIARNMLKEQGLDFDKEFSNFKKQFNL